MTEQLKAYFTFVSTALAQIEDQTEASYIQNLIALHSSQVSAFAHERLVHLLVTFFFGLAFFASMVCTTVWPMWQFFSLDALLVILLGFYIQHYFFLENTIQKLYPITQQLYHQLDYRISKPEPGHFNI